MKVLANNKKFFGVEIDFLTFSKIRDLYIIFEVKSLANVESILERVSEEQVQRLNLAADAISSLKSKSCVIYFVYVYRKESCFFVPQY